MNSIRKKLLVSILSVVTAATLLLATATYFSVREETDELYDENMKQVAVLISKMNIQNGIESPAEDLLRTKMRGEEELLIQVWYNGALDYASLPAIKLGIQTQDGFGYATFNNRAWRFYKLTKGRNVVQISQDIHKRHRVIGEIYRVLVIPILIQLPLLAALIWFLVGHILKPLRQVSDLIRKRTASFLDPLPADGVPYEINGIVDALNALLDRLKQALDLQRRFTADAAHELRTPLAAIRLQLDILRRAVGPEEQEAALLALEQGITRCIRLVQQLLELARQDPAADLPHGPVKLDLVIFDVLKRAAPVSQAKNISLTDEIEPSLSVLGNVPQLDVMIENLINNAILYTPAEGSIHVKSYRNGNHIVLDVADDGIGIADKDKARIFDRFFRVAGTGVTGSGLGLSIVRSIADAHDIEIGLVEGLNGKGVCFRLIIPVYFGNVS